MNLATCYGLPVFRNCLTAEYGPTGTTATSRRRAKGKFGEEVHFFGSEITGTTACLPARPLLNRACTTYSGQAIISNFDLKVDIQKKNPPFIAGGFFAFTPLNTQANAPTLEG